MAQLKTIVIIPARGGSKGIPNKNIIEFCGKPLMAWSIEQAINSKFVHDVYVSSDSDDILDIAKQFGAKSVKRPDNLATDFCDSETALIHTIDNAVHNIEEVGLIVFLQATSPLRFTSDIDNAISTFVSNKYDSLFSCNILEDFLIDTNTIWEKDESGQLNSLTYDYRDRKRRQDHRIQYLENGSIYLTKPDSLKTCNNRLNGTVGTYPMKFPWQAFEIDSFEGLEVCQWYMQNKILKDQFSISANEIDLIVYDFDGVMTDNRAIVLEDGTEGVYVNRSDGLAIRLISQYNVPQVIISTESNQVVNSRAKKIKIPVIYNVENKKKTLLDYCKEGNFSLDRTVFIGNDVNDIEAMKTVQFPIAPKDAHPMVKSIARLVLESEGGQGAIREFYDFMKFS